MTVRLDGGEIAAAALDAQHVDHLAEQVGHARLDRRVAAAVHDEGRNTAKQSRAVGAYREVGVDAGRFVAGDDALRVLFGPQTFQAASRTSRRFYR